MVMYLRDGSAQAIACAATLRKRFITKLANSLDHIILTHGHSAERLAG